MMEDRESSAPSGTVLLLSVLTDWAGGGACSELSAGGCEDGLDCGLDAAGLEEAEEPPLEDLEAVSEEAEDSSEGSADSLWEDSSA